MADILLFNMSILTGQG